MSFSDCVENAIKGNEVDKSEGKRAQALWKELSDRYERNGSPRHNAEAMAGEDVKEAFRKEYGEKRHVYVARIANNRKLEEGVTSAKDLKKHQTRTVEDLDYKSRALVRRFNGRLSQFLKEHHRDILGNVKKPAQMRSILKELHGESTGDAAARALADGVRESLEEMRLMFNDAGGIMGKIDNYGVPHSHNRRAITLAGFDQWFADIKDGIDWKRIEDNVTGRPFQPEGGDIPSLEIQERFLRDIYDNIKFGRESKDAVYGRPQGQALYKANSQARTLHFKDADGWVAYNKKYGSGDPFKSLMGHVHKMARDIAMMREFGPNPGLGVNYQQQLSMQRARKEGINPDKVRGNGNHAQRMFNVEAGGVMAETLAQDYFSTFMSSARHIMTSAFLDRAVIASISDVNTMRLAAQSVGMNPKNTLSRHLDLIKSSMSREDALRGGWIADTLSDPGITLARFQSEVPPAEIAERLSSASMRVQGLSGLTDMGRIAFQMEMSGLFAANAGRRIKDIDEPLRALLVERGITDSDWAAFTNPEHLYKSGNGATFASPIYWREATDINSAKAEDIFFKIQSLVEEQTEFAVPTQSLLARGTVDPAAFNMPPGTIPFEVMKSGLMFKSFAMTFTVNQIRRIASQSTFGGKINYGMNLAAGATFMGAIALQMAEITKGNDPMPMDTPGFWAKATLKGGGFGIVGDIVNTGQSSWGGGFASYIAGPSAQLLGDAWNLSIKNGFELATGQDTNFAKELATAGKRYTPLGQTPLVGPAIDRMFWDQLQLFLDPESESAMRKKATARENRDGNAEWWVPGQVLPIRAPDISGIFGQ